MGVCLSVCLGWVFPLRGVTVMLTNLLERFHKDLMVGFRRCLTSE